MGIADDSDSVTEAIADDQPNLQALAMADYDDSVIDVEVVD
jgi:hypothetical protein